MQIITEELIREDIKAANGWLGGGVEKYLERVTYIVEFLIGNSVTLQSIIKVLLLDSGKYEDILKLSDLQTEYKLLIEKIDEETFKLKLEKKEDE